MRNGVLQGITGSGKAVCTASIGGARLSAVRHKGDQWCCGVRLEMALSGKLW